MKINIRMYSLLIVVFLLSFWFASSSSTTEMLREISRLPAVGALFLALWTIFRDDAAHRKLIEVENQKQIFSISVTSHMAEVAFDKHVDFCGEYVRYITQHMPPFGAGLTSTAESFSQELRRIRNSHAPWVSSDINMELAKYEEDWRKFGVASRISEESSGQLQQNYFGIAWRHFVALNGGDASDNPTSRENMINALQDVLGVNELTKLRADIVHQAANSLTSQKHT